MRRRMKTHPRSRACSCPDTPGFRREIRSRDRVVPRRSIGRATRDRAHGAFRTRNTSISAKFAKFAPREKKEKSRSATTEKIFSIARSDLERGGFARSTTCGSRAIDDRRLRGRAIARSIDRARDRPTARARPFGTRGRARGRRRRARRAGERERGKRARAKGVRCEKIRARRRRGAGAETRSATARGRWRFIHPSRHRAIEPSIAARRARRRAWAWCRDIDRRARRR